MVNLLFGLLFLSCILTVNGNKTGSCQKFCELFASNEDVLNHNENNKTEYNEYEWCNNIVLRPLSDGKVFSNATIDAAKILFKSSAIFVFLHQDVNYTELESNNFLHSIDGILINYSQDLTFLIEVKKKFPHLKIIIRLTYKSTNEIFDFLKTLNQKIEVNYFIINEKADPLQFPKSVRAKFVFKFDEVKLAHEREMGFLNHVKKVQHIMIDHSIPNDNGIIISLSFHEKTDIIDRSFVCPIFEEDKRYKKRSPLYCYYRLPKENESTFLSPDKIPDKCDRIIIRGAEFRDGKVQFQDNISKIMMNFFQRQSFSKFLLIGSVKCENYNLYQPKGNQSSLLNSLIEYLMQYNLDGVEIDCEYFHEIISYQNFLIELKSQIGKTKILGVLLPDLERSKFTSPPNSPRCVCKVDNAVIESMDYYVIRNDNPYFYKHIEPALYQRNFYHFKYLNPSNKLEVISAKATYARIFKHEVELSEQIVAEAKHKKSFFDAQYDYTITSTSSGKNTSFPHVIIKEIIYEKTMSYKDICLQKFVNLSSNAEYDYKRCCAFDIVDNEEKFFYDDAEVIKYLNGRKSHGIAFDSLNDDDWENVCGKKKFPIFNSIN